MVLHSNVADACKYEQGMSMRLLYRRETRVTLFARVTLLCALAAEQVQAGVSLVALVLSRACYGDFSPRPSECSVLANRYAELIEQRVKVLARSG
jgi:hypothetical protein